MQGKHSVTHNEVSTGRELPAFAGVHSGREEKGQRAVLHEGWPPAGTPPHPAGYQRERRQG